MQQSFALMHCHSGWWSFALKCNKNNYRRLPACLQSHVYHVLRKGFSYRQCLAHRNTCWTQTKTITWLVVMSNQCKRCVDVEDGWTLMCILATASWATVPEIVADKMSDAMTASLQHGCYIKKLSLIHFTRCSASPGCVSGVGAKSTFLHIHIKGCLTSCRHDSDARAWHHAHLHTTAAGLPTQGAGACNQFAAFFRDSYTHCIITYRRVCPKACTHTSSHSPAWCFYTSMQEEGQSLWDWNMQSFNVSTWIDVPPSMMPCQQTGTFPP